MTAKDNVHLHEINKFGSMAERWWDAQGEFKTLHDINPLRINLSRVMRILPANALLMWAAVAVF